MEHLDYEIGQFVPKYIREDPTGKALVAAIDLAMHRLTDAMELTDLLLTDADNMPEWALDEMAWASAMPWYDFTAPIDIKRRWVKYADEIRACEGTRAAISKLLLGMYDQCAIEEYWEYGGGLNHFRVAVRGEYDPAKMRMAAKAINAVKPLRCVLDNVAMAVETRMTLTEKREMMAVTKPACGAVLCGNAIAL